jgi:predicted aspartyl protease
MKAARKPAIITACLLKSVRLHALALVSVTIFFAACQTIDTARFSYANSRSTHSWSGTTQTTTVPFSLVDNHIVLPVSVNGSETMDFVLDSGAAASVIFESYHTRMLSLQTSGELHISGAGDGGDAVAGIAKNISLSVGSLRTEGQSLLYLPIGSVPFFDDMDDVYFDGVLGALFFERFRVMIDYHQQLLSFSEPGYESSEVTEAMEAWEWLPLHMESGLPYLTTEVTDNRGEPVTVKLLVDTGARGLMSLNPETSASLAPPERHFSTVSQGLSGNVQGLVGITDSLSLGPYRLLNLPINYTVTGGESDHQSNGILSNEVLSRFNLLFDGPGGRLYFTPNWRFDMPITADRSGLSIRAHSAGGIIKRVAPRSAGDVLGLAAGDIITSFDGTTVTPETITVLKRELASPRDSLHLCWRSRTEGVCGDILLQSRFGEADASERPLPPAQVKNADSRQ